MSNDTYTLKVNSDGKAKFRMIIPVQYCTDELFRDISLIITGKANQNINVRKANLQFEAEFEETIGEHKYSMILKKNSDQIDSREIILNVIHGEKQEKVNLVIRFKETSDLIKKDGSKDIASIYYYEPDDLLLIGVYKKLEVYRKRTLEHIDTLEGHSGYINAIVYDELNNTFLTAGKDKVVRWDLKSGSPVELITDFVTNFGNILSLFISNRKTFVIISESAQPYFSICNLYDKNDKIQIDKKASYTPSIVKFYSEAQDILFGDSPEDSVKIFSLTEKKIIQNRLMLESGTIKNITVIPGGKYFMTLSEKSDHFKIWTFNEWRLHKKVPIRKEPNSSSIADVILDEKNGELIIIYRSGTLDIYDWYGVDD